MAQSPLAQIIAASLDQNGTELARNNTVKKWNILGEKLFLQRNGMGGDNDLLIR